MIYDGIFPNPYAEDAYDDAFVTRLGNASAYDELAGVECGTYLTGNLAGLVLTPGVYCVEAASTTTGGGQIPVPDPNSTGRATFGFNAQPDKKDGAKGNFNYVNHVTGLHVNGAVDYIKVIAINPNGSPKTVLFSGTWEGGSFFVTVEDKGEPGRTDEFGITVTTATGVLSEVRSQRVISNGNIQFHK